MIRHQGIHEKDIVIGTVIRNQNIWTFWYLLFSLWNYPNKTTNAHNGTPDYIDRKTKASPFNFKECNVNEGIEKQERK